MMSEQGGVPDLLLEQYALGELGAVEKARLDSLLESDPGLRARLAELKASDEEILAELPPAEIAASIRRRMLVAGEPGGPGKGRSGRGPRFLSARALAFPAAAAVLVVAGAMMVRGLFPTPSADRVLAKGGAPGLLVYRKTDSGAELLADGARAAAGDVLQIKYSGGSPRFGVIVSLDGRGRITWHLPSEYGDSAPAGPVSLAPRLESPGATLGSAYELDDAPSFERFFIFSSSDDFSLSVASKILGVLSRSPSPAEARPSLPDGIECKSFLLLKDGRPR